MLYKPVGSPKFTTGWGKSIFPVLISEIFGLLAFMRIICEIVKKLNFLRALSF